MRLAPNRQDKYSRLEFMIYAISWLIVICIPFATQAYDLWSGLTTSFNMDAVWSSLAIIGTIFFLFLVNNFVLLPRLFFKKHFVAYFLSLIALFALLWLVQQHPAPPSNLPAPPPPHERRHGMDMFHIFNLIIEICVVLANFAIKVYIQSIRRDMVLLKVKNENMHSELESLKYQMSPHFLMNTLNNIQSLIEVDASCAHDTIQDLSGMLRYLLYENSDPTVPLTREIDFINDFTRVMKLRFTSNVQISMRFPEDVGGVNVPPLLFIAFVENAFKYGASNVGDSFIAINMKIEDGYIDFACLNSLNHRARSQNGVHGIGIENVRRRLDLIYGSDYTLKISPTDQTYHVHLRFPITP